MANRAGGGDRGLGKLSPGSNAVVFRRYYIVVVVVVVVVVAVLLLRCR